VWGERLHGQDRVTVQLGVTPASVSVFDPTIGVEPVQTPTNGGCSNSRSATIRLSSRFRRAGDRPPSRHPG
jgi:hypothetical protein